VPPSVAIACLLAAQVPEIARTVWPADAIRGASGLTAHGAIYLAVPERQRFLAPFEVHERGVSPKPRLSLEGVPDGIDVESIASLPGDRLALGTEGKVGARSGDKILIASVGPGGAKVESELVFDYGRYGIRAERNHGVEGLCFTDGRLIAAAEQIIEEERARFAPLSSYDFGEKRWSQYRVRLTTDTGKISGLACRKTDTAREVFAIERHYSVSRILRFTLPLLDTGGDIEPELLLDLTGLYREEIPNFEGIALHADGRLLLISDNDYAGTQGPTHIVLVKPAPKEVRRIKPGAFVR
jgi:hypothetical protein